jgi:hypothetical protein
LKIDIKLKMERKNFKQHITMDSPTYTTTNANQSTTQSKDYARNQEGETLGTPPRYNETREDAVGIDVSGQSSPTRQADEEAETAEQRAAREEEESLELARAMMAEEAMGAYSAHMDYLRHNQDQFSEEDLAAFQIAMDDDEQEANTIHDNEEDNGQDISGMSYEAMLQLGERIGDVKTERWTQRAQNTIDTLPIIKFDRETIKSKSNTNQCDTKCLICQEEYCTGEDLRQLPCRHCFHQECVDQWLLTKDFCPYCRTSLEKE